VKARVARLLLATLLGTATAASAVRGGEPDVFNYALSPELAGWMIGAPARLATAREIREFTALTDDAAARRFIEKFWAARDDDPKLPGNPVREAVEERAIEADRRFTEAGRPGRGTDRGTTYILYGEPAKIDFEPSKLAGEGTLEVWHYPPGGRSGLDGKKPQRQIRFSLEGEVTKFYVPGHPESRTRDHL
jgi:GWxTD domain-containing protein